MPKEKDNSSTSTLSGSHPPILLKQIVVWKPVNVASKIGVAPVGTTSSNGPFSIAVIVYRSAVAEKPPNMDLAKVLFLVRETFGKIATCQVPRAVSEQISQFHSSRRNFSILKQIYPLIPCEKGPFLKKGPKLIPQITLNECQPHGGTYVAICKNHFGYLPIDFDPLPGPPNNHFLVDVWWFPTISHVRIWFIIQLKQPLKYHQISRWWFQIFFIFTPTWGRFPFWLYNIFQMGWNHQLDMVGLGVPIGWISVENFQPARPPPPQQQPPPQPQLSQMQPLQPPQMQPPQPPPQPLNPNQMPQQARWDLVRFCSNQFKAGGGFFGWLFFGGKLTALSPWKWMVGIRSFPNQKVVVSMISTQN